MRLMSFSKNGLSGLALASGSDWLDLTSSGLPSDMSALLRSADWRVAVEKAAQNAPRLELEGIRYLPPFRTPEKILCVGLNYVAHVAESPYKQPDYPTFFARFASTLIGHEEPMVRPRCSDQLDYEAEMVAVIGTGGRHIRVEDALSHVAGYSVFNEGSVRDYQFKAPQWTVGKNFDDSGAFGPLFVTADELPPGGKGLRITTRVNGQIEQDANTSDLIFDVATLISIASEAFTLRAGDVFVTGTPAGVGFGKKPPVYLKAGDVCEIEVEQIGLLRNPVVDEA